MSHFKIIVPQSSAITNLCTNPSFETNTTGWTFPLGGGGRDPEYAFRGLYSDIVALVGAHDRSVVASYAITLPTAGSYILSAYVYCPSALLTGAEIDADGFAGSTLTQPVTYGSSQAGIWTLVRSQLDAVAGDLVGTIRIRASNTTDTSIQFDGILIARLTTSGDVIVGFDGDTTGCYWTGAQHASTSVAPAGTRNVGVETDLDDLNYTVLEGTSGLGMPPLKHKTTGTSNDINQVITAVDVLPRVLTIPGLIQATSRATLHSYRKDILDVIYPNDQRLTYFLRYYGANSNKPVEGEFIYDSGFEYNEGAEIGFNEDILWRSIGYDPTLYELQNQKAALTTRGTATTDYVAAKINGDWTDLGSTFNGAVHALAYDHKNDILYAGGEFTTPSNYLSQYVNGAWADVGVGFNEAVYALAVAPNGDLYIGGNFTDINGGGLTNANYIAMWDYSASAFVALGTGMNAAVYCLGIDKQGKVYVGGSFTTANAVTVNRFTYWNGTTFVSLDSGVNSTVYGIAIDRSNNVYIGGDFTTVGTGATTANRTAKWNGTAYSALGTGMSDTVRVMEIDAAGNVYAGGIFATADGLTVNKIAIWTGAGWLPLGTGVSGGDVYSIGVFSSQVWVGGTFTSAGGRTLNDRLAIWNQTEWVHADIDLPGSPYLRAIKVINISGTEDIYLGFSTTGAAVYSVDTTVTNNGSAAVYPTFEIWNEGASATESIVYLKNETTNTTLWMDYTLQIEEKITIDFNPRHFSVVSDHYSDVSQMILGGSDRNFYLRPGVNVITCFTKSATVTAGLMWRIAHWSADGVAA